MKIINKWYVKLLQEEVEKCQTGKQLLTFMSIKSYCANGKRQVGLSIRDISGRSKVSIGQTRSKINEIKHLGLVFTDGTEARRGGYVEVFGIGAGLQPPSVPENKASVPPATISVPITSTNPQQSNKVIKKENKTTIFSYKNQNQTSEADSLFVSKEKLWDWAEIISKKGEKVNV